MLCDWLGDCDCVCVSDGDWLGLADGLGETDWLGVEVPLAVAEPLLVLLSLGLWDWVREAVEDTLGDWDTLGDADWLGD